MLQLNIPNLEEDILASSLRRHQSRLQEVLDAVERRDMSSQEVKEYLKWMATELKSLRKYLMRAELALFSGQDL